MFVYRGFQCVNHSPEVLKIKENLLSDISNITYHYNEEIPKMHNFELMFNTYKYDYYIRGIADWKLYYYIDDKSSYEEYKLRRIILDAPPRIEADELLIRLAIYYDCPIVTNDKFRDHTDLIPSKSWLYKHRIPFDIIKGKFIIYFP